MEKCRLEGHVLEVPQAYETVFEWDGHPVHARSSMPLDAQLLHLSSLPPATTTPAAYSGGHFEAPSTTTGNTSMSPAQAFSRALRQAVMQDLRLLPVRDPHMHYVERGNVTVYANSSSSAPVDPRPPLISTHQEEVLVVYAPCSLTSTVACVAQPQQLEFASFVLGSKSSP